MFPNGAPVDSMLNVHNGKFKTCGQIVAVSIVQGGPPPCFVDECVYQMLADPAVDMSSLSINKHFTDSVASDPNTHQDTIVVSFCVY